MGMCYKGYVLYSNITNRQNGMTNNYGIVNK